MSLTSWNSWTYYDPMIGDEGICVTGYTGRGAYWIRAALTPSGKSRRAQRDEFLNRISAAIEAGDPPGEVSTKGPSPAQDMEGEHGRAGEDRGLY